MAAAGEAAAVMSAAGVRAVSEVVDGDAAEGLCSRGKLVGNLSDWWVGADLLPWSLCRSFLNMTAA